MGVLDLTWNDEENRSTKRKKFGDTNIEEDKTVNDGERMLAGKIVKIIKDLDEEIRIMSKVVKDNVNTKREIKDSIAKLRSKMSQLMTCEAQGLLSVLGRTQSKENPSPRPTRDWATQSYMKKDDVNVDGHNTGQDQKRNVKEKTGNQLDAPNDYDLAVWVSKDLKMSKGVARLVRERYQGIEELREQEAAPWGVAYLVHTIRMPIKDGEYRSRDRYVYHLVDRETEESETDWGNTLASIAKMRDIAQRDGRKKVAISIPTFLDGEKLKCCIERTFANSDIEVALYIKKERRTEGQNANTADEVWTEVKAKKTRTPKAKQPEVTRGKPTRKPTTEAVFVKGTGKTYADLLRTVRNQVSLEGTDIKIAGVRKTAAGEIMISMAGGGQAELLKQKIIEGVQGITARTRSTDVVLIIKGIDGAATTQEVQTAIEGDTSTDKDGGVKEIRMSPAYGGNETATVTVTQEAAQRLLQDGRVRIGWTSCRIMEKIEVLKCYRCWIYGHVAAACTGTDRTETCVKCGQQGHKVKECGHNPYCVICKVEGHRTGSGGCPVHRRMLAEARRKTAKS